jgi:hypothetical protein
VVGLDRRILYLVGVAVGGVGAYLIYKWVSGRRFSGGVTTVIPVIQTGGGEVKRVETPGGGWVEVRRDSPDKVTIVYTNPQGSTFTITVPSGTEDAVIALLRGEAMQEYYETQRSDVYYRKMLEEKPWVPETQPAPIEYAEGGVPSELRFRLPAMM